MIKLIIFDLDGVLVDSAEMHRSTFNKTLKEIDIKYIILKRSDGLSMLQKLKILTDEKGLPVEKYNQILKRKQELMIRDIKSNVFPSIRLIQLFDYLKKCNFIIYIASNSRKNTVKQFLIRLELMKYITDFISSEDINNHKPNPEIYLKIMNATGTKPKETLIIEDSPVGIKAAINSGGCVYKVKTPQSITRNIMIKLINNER